MKSGMMSSGGAGGTLMGGPSGGGSGGGGGGGFSAMGPNGKMVMYPTHLKTHQRADLEEGSTKWGNLENLKNLLNAGFITKSEYKDRKVSGGLCACVSAAACAGCR
jgi:hypothetical protein